MATLNYRERAVPHGAGVRLIGVSLISAPPNYLSIAFGLAGLAAAWNTAGALFGAPIAVADALYLLASTVYVLLLAGMISRFAANPRAIAAALSHQVLGPFYSLAPITGMVLALGLAPHAPSLSRALFVVFLAMTLLVGGWLIGQWIAGPLDQDSVHPGYFLPTVAGGLIGAQVAAALNLTALGWVCFGLGLLSWLLLGSLILNRLFVQPLLPPALIPTLAIQIAPPAVAGNAYAALTGGRADQVAYGLAGYLVLMVLVQMRLLPTYRALHFSPGFWAFTFSYSAVAVDVMHWIDTERPAGAIVLGYIVLGVITLFVGSIAARSIVDLREGRLFPAAARVEPR